MKAQLIDGKRISAEIKAEAAEEAAALKAKGITPCLAVVLVGDDSASQVYAVSYTHLTLPTNSLV